MVKPAMARRAFTLLEAILALAIITAVIVVCLGLRAQALGASRRIAMDQQSDRVVQEVYECLVAGLLEDPVVDPDTGVRTWTGERLGEPFTLTATFTDAPNPIFGVDEDKKVGDRVRVWKYRMECAGRTTEFYWRK